jgi:hypothetical protein
MGGKRGVAVAVLVLLLTAGGCGKVPNKDPTTPADTGDPAATTAIVVARNTSDKIATGVTAEVKWPTGYARSQDQAIVIPPGERGVFLLPNFDAPPDLHGQPKASVLVNKVTTAKREGSPVKLDVQTSAVNKALRSGSCTVTGTATNEFDNERPGRAGLIAGLKDDKIVTAGTIFFEEPGLVPGKQTKFKVSLEPLCKKSDSVDDVVSYVSLTEEDLQNP